jgi:uncharacterized protein YkwD
VILPLMLLCAAPAAAAPLEAEAAHAVREQFERVGRTTPTLDPALSKAARILAQKALDTSASDAAELLTLTAAVSEAGGFDATPRALVLRGSPSTEPLLALAKRDDLTAEPCTHLGVGAVKKGDLAALVVLFALRRVELAPFVREFTKVPAPQKLCARLLEPLTSAEVFVTRPLGAVDKTTMRSEHGGQVCAAVELPAEGRHTVEILARGDRGPQVAALFFVQVGAVTSTETPLAEREPATLEDARGKLLKRINALRVASAASPLSRDFELDTVAQAYAERLAKENFFAHVAPDGEDLKARMRRADYPYSAAGENLGLANGPLAAHFSIEHSPGHRKNLLDTAYSRAGIGWARNALGQALVVEVLANPTNARPDEDPVVEANRALAELRKSKGLPPLKRTDVLDQLATAHARRALELNTPKAKLPNENLHDRVFAARDDLKSTSVDFFVTDSPSAVTDSKNLVDPRVSLLGIGVAKGDSPTYGSGKFWIVIIYASTLE